MGSSTSEIVELDDDLGFAQHFSKLSIEVKAEAEKEDLNQLMKSIELRNSYRVSGSIHHNISLNKRTSKELTEGGPSQTSGVSNSESVTLKQALRKLCVSQASEMAAMKKRSSRPSCLLSDIPEAGTVKRLLASVVVPSTESEAEKGNRVEKGFVPEKALEVSESSNQIPVLPKVKIKVPRIQDVMSESTEESSSSTHVKEIKRKEKSVSNNSAKNKPMIIKPVVNKVTNVKKKVQKEQASTKESKTTKVASVSSQAKCKNSECVKDKDNSGLQETNAATPSSCKSGAMNSRKREKGESSQSSKSSIGDYSTSTSLSDDSHQNSSGSSGSRPHMSKDIKWKAIHDVISMQNGNLGLSNFKLVKRLGCGDIGTVYLAELSGSDCMFALKVMDVEFLISRKKMLRAQTEREILQMLDHPFLPTLYASFITDNLSCLVMEYCPGGDLHVLRQRQPRRCFSEPAARLVEHFTGKLNSSIQTLEEKKGNPNLLQGSGLSGIKFYVAEVLLALEYLHMLGVIYRDLKPENILVREDGHIMLSDFDLSLRCRVSPTLLQSTPEPIKTPSYPCPQNDCISKPVCLQNSWTHSSCFSPRPTPSFKAHKHASDRLPQLIVEPTEARSNSFVGTHEYLAPEIIRGDGHGSAVDWWTLGIFLYELLYGKTPFKGADNDETLTNVISQSLKFPESGSVSFHARDLIGALLVKEPENRLGSNRGAAEIKQHPFFEGLNWALIRCASPPEVLKSCDIRSTEVGGSKRKKEGMCLGMRSYGNDSEFEMF